jgi:hypothetical protein
MFSVSSNFFWFFHCDRSLGLALCGVGGPGVRWRGSSRLEWLAMSRLLVLGSYDVLPMKQTAHGT